MSAPCSGVMFPTLLFLKLHFRNSLVPLLHHASLACVVIQGSLRFGGIGRKKNLEKLSWISSLPLCGEYKAGQDAMRSQSAYGSSAEHDFPEDYQKADRLLRLIVCRLHPGVAKKGEQVLAILDEGDS